MYDTVESLKEAYRRGEKISMCFFWGHHQKKEGCIDKSCLSQWYLSEFVVEGNVYCCMEQFMMAEKARLFDDLEVLEMIMKEKDPKVIKALGRKIHHFDVEKWTNACQQIVRRGNLAKFEQNKMLCAFLLAQKETVFVEASPYDTVWGIGMSEQEKEAHNPMSWKGTNYLGFALTWVREELAKHTTLNKRYH